MKNILFLGSHFDDIELGCGGTIAKLKKEGKKVVGCVLTNSAYTNFDGTIYRQENIALKEGKAAAKVLGYELIYGHYATKTLQFNAELIEYINKIIVDHKIDTMFTHWVYDIQNDHYAASRASITAARHVPNVLMYRANWYVGPEVFKANYFVDVTRFVKLKIKAVKMHQTEHKRRGDTWVNYFLDQDHAAGRTKGVEYAESFSVVSLLQ